MSSETPVPRWLWYFANGMLALVVAGIAGLALALSRGLADPPRAGPLWLFDDFKGDVSQWTFIADGGATLQAREGALIAEFTAAPEQSVVALADGPGGDFSLEIAGTPMANSNDMAYGLIFNWQDAAHYGAALVNGNGYVEAYRQNGDKRVEWFKWQQWPHAFGGDNRVRVDVRAGRVTVRVNDEWLTEAAWMETGGKIGVVARGVGGPGGVVFSWVKVWAAP
jgi:hypothetical protein